MDAGEIREYVDRSEAIIERSPQMDEQNTKVKLVQPLIDLLGWDIYSGAVELEYPIQMGVGKKKVDFALQIDDEPIVLLEAKGLDTSITDGHVSQLKSYMRQELSVQWGILTNGQEFHVFTKEDARVGGGERKIGEFDLEEFAENPDMLGVLSKESIASGHSKDVIEELNEIQQALEELRSRKEPLSEELSSVVTNEIGPIHAVEIETEAKEFVDKLIRRLDAQASLADIGRSRESRARDTPTEWAPDQEGNAIAGQIHRSELDGPDDAVVAVFPCKESGIPFLKENNAWGFVRIGQVPDFAAFYITRTAREVQFVAEVKDVVSPEQAELARPLEEYIGDQAEFDPNKRVVRFLPETLYELADPIPFGDAYPQGLRYTDLGRLKTASVTDDLF